MDEYQANVILLRIEKLFDIHDGGIGMSFGDRKNRVIDLIVRLYA